MNNHPPAGSFRTHRQKAAQPRMAFIATRESRKLETVTGRSRESLSLRMRKSFGRIKRKGRAPVSSNDA